ncbi:MAG: Hsp20/alpha crystallin family protein [Acidimicrobiales bacterium]|nr:Hsp20/alpha crystallin family protein [Acidimicrobiales bacterium]
MLLRFDPFRDLDRLAEQAFAPVTGARRVPMDAVRRGEKIVISFDLPGVDPASVDLTVEDNSLTLKAERRPERLEGDEVIIGERSYGAFTRQLFLGDNLDTAGIEAAYVDGVLTVTVPMAEQAKPRKVAVTTGGGVTPIETNAHEG